MDDGSTSISGKAALGLTVGALAVGAALGLFLSRKGRSFSFAYRPSGIWAFLAPAVEIKLEDNSKKKEDDV